MKTEEEIKKIVSTNIEQATDYLNEYVMENRNRATAFYYRRPYQNELGKTKGRSSVIDSAVQESVMGSLGELVKPFLSLNMCEFRPTANGSAEQSKVITDVTRYVLFNDNNGADIIRDAFFNALLKGLGVIKCYYDENVSKTKETYTDVSEQELGMLLNDKGVEIIEQQENVQEPVPVGQDPMTGEPLLQSPPSTYDVILEKTEDCSRVKIENINPDEFIINKDAESIADSSFVAQRLLLTRADLINMGYKKSVVDSLQTDDEDGFDFNGEINWNRDTEDTVDPSQELIACYECYVDIGNEKSETIKHKILYASKTILSDEEIDYIPFYSLCPFPMPNEFYGQSMADHTMDLQVVKTSITRQMLDNLYLTNNSRVGAVEGQVNLDDLLNSTAGGIIRMKNPNAIVPMQVQSSAGQSFPMLEYLDQLQAKRTGVSDLNQGLDANVLQNVSATAVATMTAQAQGKLELIARTFADTGIKSLIQGIFHLLCKYQNEPRVINIAGAPLEINPREWDDRYKVDVNVGLGKGTQNEKIGMLQMVLAKQEQILQQYGINNPLVTLQQYRDTLAKFINASGMEDDRQFIKPVTNEEMAKLMQMDAQADKTPPQVKAAEAIAQAEREKAQMKMQTDMAKQQLETQKLQFQTEKEAQELQLKAQQQQLDADRQMLEIETERAKLEADIQLRESEIAIKEQKNVITADNDQTKNIINAVDKLASAAQGNV
jgi:hypothetical protein